MYIIEPCCAARHLMQLRDAIGKNGTKEFEGYGDLSLTELLPALLTRYSETDMLIVAPTLPDQAAEVIEEWMCWQRSRRDGQGKLDYVRHLTVIANLSRRKSPVASQWKKENPFGERLTLVDSQQDDTVILLPDFAITGPVNMRYGEHFVATATNDPERVAELWRRYANVNGPSAGTTEETVEEPAQEPAAEPIAEPIAEPVAEAAVAAEEESVSGDE